jgi:hypothetical protein
MTPHKYVCETYCPVSDVTNENVFYVFTSITLSSNRTDDESSQDIAMLLPEHSTRLQAELPCQKQGQGLSLEQCVRNTC